MPAIWGAAIGAGASYLGGQKDKEMASRMKHARERAIKRMKRYWKRAYQESQAQFRGARQDILGAGQAGFGNALAGAQAGGLMNTTAGMNMARGASQDQARQLRELGRQRGAMEYSQWMDRANIAGMTPYDNFAPQGQAGAWGEAGAGLGQMLGQIDWSSLFGGKQGGGNPDYNWMMQQKT